jgi:hypothetical protein
MNLTVRRRLTLFAMFALLLPVGYAHAQGVTTGSMTGVVVDAQKQVVPGASVVAVHEPSGTRYEATTRADGRFSIPGMRVGPGYSVTASLTGFQPQTVKDVTVSLGVATDLQLTLGRAAVSEEVTVTARTSEVFSSARTGAATSVGGDLIHTLPTINDRVNDYARLSPQYSGSGSFVGQDSRLNNITVDGSYFNNSFGLGGQPGDRTNVTPISTAAVEEIQINTAPYDVRQGHFVGAGVNMVTRSGTSSTARPTTGGATRASSAPRPRATPTTPARSTTSATGPGCRARSSRTSSSSSPATRTTSTRRPERRSGRTTGVRRWAATSPASSAPTSMP